MNKKRKIIGIITAAGSGERFGKTKRGALPKQFQNMAGKPVIVHSLLVFQSSAYVNEIFVSANPEYFDLIHALAAKYRITKLKGIVEGGNTRFESVRNAFYQIEGSGNDIVLIHDAARPNISKKFLNNIAEGSFRYGEVIPGLCANETMKRVNKSGYVSETIDRRNVFFVQTPQAFRCKILEESYRKAGKSKRTDFTDEAQAVEHAGFKIKMIDGLKDNVKITTPEDIALLKKLMK